MTYSANIQRLRESGRALTSDRISHRNQATKTRNQSEQEYVDDIATKLSGFSRELGEWKQRDIQRKTEEGVRKAREARVADAAKIAELAEELTRTKKEDTRYQEIKQEMLRLGGENAYPDADRIAGLSPWQQVGYAKEKLRAFNETFPDKLAHAMQNSQKAITIQGVTFTPAQLRENNIQGLPFKEAAIKVLSEDIRKAANVDRFSPELLALAGTDETIIKSQDTLMGKYRERYNIDASSNTRIKAQKEWQTSGRTSEDLYRLFLINSNTVDANGKLNGNAGGWDNVMKILTNEGISRSDPLYADKMGAMLLPEDLRIKLGAKKGTTFAQQWPGRFAKMKSDIKKGYVDAVKAELNYQKAFGQDLEAKFIEQARKGDLSTEQVNQYKRRFGELGLPIPSGVTNYETVSMRNEREDKQLIKALMASQNGYISHEQLDGFHPLAALEHREKATKMEGASLDILDAEDKIKAHLNTAFTDMGIKANEKSPAWVEAFANAKADYNRQFHKYVAMGYPQEQAAHWALHAAPGEVKDNEGRPIAVGGGVLHEIKANGAGAKYVQIGQSLERQLGPGRIRVARIASAKAEILNDPNAVTNRVIGDAYGHNQLQSIRDNIDKYGERGIYMDKGALAYYQGIARGRNPREGGWWGLLDAQLKADGHAGLPPQTKPPIVDISRDRDDSGAIIPDPIGQEIMRRRLGRAAQYPSLHTNRYIMNTAKDGYHNSGSSTFDEDFNINSYLRGLR